MLAANTVVRRKRMSFEKRLHARHMRIFKTPAEAHLWERIKGKALGAKFRCQAPMWGYIADFYAPQYALCIEVDGGYHKPRTDAVRDKRLAEHGILTIRFRNDRVMNDIEGVICEIRTAIRAREGLVAKRVRRKRNAA